MLLLDRVTGEAEYEQRYDETMASVGKKTGTTQWKRDSKPAPESIQGYVTDFDDETVSILFHDETGFEELVEIDISNFPGLIVSKNLNVIFSVYEQGGRIIYEFEFFEEEYPDKDDLKRAFKEAENLFPNLEE